MTTLVFPGGMPDSLTYLRQAKADGQLVMGASSLTEDPAKGFYPDWAFLPFVTDESFETTFLKLVKEKSIKHVFTRHPIIRRYIRTIIEKHSLTLSLNESAFALATMHANVMLMERVRKLRKKGFSWNVPNGSAALSELEMAAVLHHASHIEGQSDEDKIHALMEAFRTCPQGDVVEIGSFWGRSGFVLSWLARKYEVGSLLCVDPWTNENAHQEGVSEFVNDEAREIDFTRTFEGFLLNLIPYDVHHINYIKAPSHEGRASYQTQPFTLESEPFGKTQYQGKIAFLHIDGNHDLQHITEDIADWCPLVVPGGWIVIDDYEWSFGDGPKRAADRWLAENKSRIRLHFVTGSALFVKFNDEA